MAKQALHLFESTRPHHCEFERRKFAERYRIELARLGDWEQGRLLPDTVALAYLRVIERDAAAVDRALAD